MNTRIGKHVLFFAVRLISILGSVVLLAIGIGGQVTFEGTPSAEFHSWVTRPLFFSGLISITFLLVSIAWTMLQPRQMQTSHSRTPTTMATGTLVAAVVVLASGIYTSIWRSHPDRFEQTSLAHLNLPLGVQNDQTAVVSYQQVPAEMRSWSAGDTSNSCTSLHQFLLGWADAQSTNAPQSFNPIASEIACEWFAQYRGWPIRAEVVSAGGATRSEVVITPPGTR